MPRHLISDAHEWINEIPTVPTYPLSIERSSRADVLESDYQLSRARGFVFVKFVLCVCFLSALCAWGLPRDNFQSEGCKLW
jgi:hypothetical protein